MALLADFRALLPQFATVSDATVQAWLDTAAPRVSEDVYGSDYDTAHIYLAAHMMSMAGIGPEAGAAGMAPLKSFSSGGVSMTKDDKRGDYGLTSFGRLFWPLWQSYHGGPLVTGTGEYPWPYGGERVE